MKLFIALLAVMVLVACTPAVTNTESDDTSSPAAAQTSNAGDSMDNDSMDEDMMDKSEKNIVETAVDAGSFTTLVTAVQEAGLVETLSGEGPFTVFAPTDDAFAKLDEETLNGLLADPEALAQVLKYHVVSGEVTAEEAVVMDSVATLEGSDVTITVEGDTVMVNDATVVQPDIMTSNGVIHVIDTVLIPHSN